MKDALVSSLLLSWKNQRGLCAKLVADLSDADMVSQPVAGIVMNHPAWTLGHLSPYPPVLSAILKGEEFVDPLNSRYGRGTKPMGDVGAYPAKAALVAEYLAGHDLLARTLEGVDTVVMAKPIPLGGGGRSGSRGLGMRCCTSCCRTRGRTWGKSVRGGGLGGGRRCERLGRLTRRGPGLKAAGKIDRVKAFPLQECDGAAGAGADGAVNEDLAGAWQVLEVGGQAQVRDVHRPGNMGLVELVGLAPDIEDQGAGGDKVFGAL